MNCKEEDDLGRQFVIPLSNLAIAMLFLYLLSYSPFISESFILSSFRIGIEGFLIFILMAIHVKYQNVSIDMLWVIPVLYVFILLLCLDVHTFIKLISSFNKVFFFILILGLFLRNEKVLMSCRKIWVQLSWLLCGMTILAFLGYQLGFLSFSPIGGGEGGGYYYFHNDIFGNLSPRKLFGVDFGRVAGYMYEPGYLAAFLGFNILIVHNLIENFEKRKMFVLLNFMAALTTLSTTFFFFFAFYFSVKVAIFYNGLSFGVKWLLGLLIVFFVVYFVFMSNYFGETSGSARLHRMAIVWGVFDSANLGAFFFGNGIGISVEKFHIGIDSGWLALFIERGFIMLIVMLLLVVKFTMHNVWLMLYVLYCNFALSLFWTPLFLFLIAISYSHYRSGKRLDKRLLCKGSRCY